MNMFDNVWRIAKTGETQEPQTSPVDNIMAMQNKSRWDKAKDFAGSVAGRNLLGGLTTAAAVALTGGNLKDAVGYGVIGAGRTMDTQNQKKQYDNKLAMLRQQRDDQIAQKQEDRNFQLQMLDKRLAAQKDLADYDFENTLRKIAMENQFSENAKAKEKEERQNQYAAGREWLQNADFDDDAKKQLLQNYDAGYYGVTLPAEKKYAAGNLGLAQMAMDNGKTFDEAMDRLGYIPSAQKMENEKELYGWQKGVDSSFSNQAAYRDALLAENKAQSDYGRGQAAADAQAQRNRDFETFKNSLPTGDILKARQQAEILQQQGYNLNAGDIIKMQYEKQLAEQEKQRLEIEAARQKMQTAPSDPVEEYRRKKEIDLQMKQQLQQRQEKAEQAKKEQRNAVMRPRLLQAIERGRRAVKDGTGLGQFGGWGWTTEQGGRNRADIQTAQAQINTEMRDLLAEMGVGSTELNSAAEAAAYRYQISPDMPAAQIWQILNNFEQDYMDGSLQAEAAAVAGQYRKTPQDDYSQVSDDDLLRFES